MSLSIAGLSAARASGIEQAELTRRRDQLENLAKIMMPGDLSVLNLALVAESAPLTAASIEERILNGASKGSNFVPLTADFAGSSVLSDICTRLIRHHPGSTTFGAAGECGEIMGIDAFELDVPELKKLAEVVRKINPEFKLVLAQARNEITDQRQEAGPRYRHSYYAGVLLPPF